MDASGETGESAEFGVPAAVLDRPARVSESLIPFRGVGSWVSELPVRRNGEPSTRILLGALIEGLVHPKQLCMGGL
eukprot:1978377-Alexandrium_andersonii.AAC.1